MSSPATSPAPSQPVSPQERNKAATWQFFDQVFNKGNMEVVSLLGSNYKFNGQAQNNNGFIGWVQKMRSMYPDMQVTFVSNIAEGNAVAIRWQMTGTHPGADGGYGWSIEATGNNLLTYDDEGHCLTNDQAGSCTRTQDGVSTTHDSGNILDLMFAP